jgi:hypothetical protein
MAKVQIKETVELLRRAANSVAGDDKVLAVTLTALRQMKLEPAANGDADSWLHTPTSSIRKGGALMDSLMKASPGHSGAEMVGALPNARKVWNDFVSAIGDKKKDNVKDFNKWLTDFYALGESGWSIIDDKCWGDAQHSWDDEGRKIIVLPSERRNGGREYRIVALDPEDIIANSYGRTESISDNIRKWFSKPMIRLTKTHAFDEYAMPLEHLRPDYLSAAAIASGLLSYTAVTDLDGKVVGLRPNNGGSGLDLAMFAPSSYLTKTYPFLLANKERQIEHVSAISNDPDEPTLCYIRNDFEEKDCPTWLKWIEDTFENPEEDGDYFKAWCGSILDAKNTGKQALYLHGFGSQGLSKVTNALLSVIGTAGAAVSGTKSFTNQFGLAKLEGKRLVVISDNKNPKIMMTEWVHNLTGGDVVDIERKGKDSHAAQLIGKLMICGNIPPEINFDETNQKNRVLYIPMKFMTDEDKAKASNWMKRDDGTFVMIGDASFGRRLVDEAEAFLGLCWKYYKKYAPNGADIIVSHNKELQMEAELMDTDSANLMRLMEAVFDFGKEYESSPSEIYDAYCSECKAYGLSDDNQYYGSRVRAFLLNSGVKFCKRKGVRKDGVFSNIPAKVVGIRVKPKGGQPMAGVV